MARLMAWSVEGIGEIVPGQQLGDVIVEACSAEPVSYTHLTLPTSDLV